MKNLRRLSRCSAYSLVELATAVTILGLMAGALSYASLSNERAYQAGFSAASLEAQAATAMNRIVAELEVAAVDTLAPDPAPGLGTDRLDYALVTGIAAGNPIVTPPRRLEFEYETGEIDDGLDNNGNGLVDEGRVVLTEDVGGPDERRRVLTRWVSELMQGELPNGLDDNGNGLADERGFCLVRVEGADSETLVVRLSLARRDARGNRISRTVETAVKIRNRVD